MQDDEVRSRPPNTKEKRPLLAEKASPPSHMNTENFTKDLEVRRDLGNRAYAKRPLEGLQWTRGGKRGVGMGRTNANADLSIFFSNRQKSAELANSKGRALGKVLSVLHQHCNLVPTGKELKENLGKIKHKQRDKHCGFSNFCVNLTFSRLLFNIIFKSDLKWPLKKLKWRSLKITFENSLCWIAYETSRL